jgi:hypothetical protein
MIEERKFVTAYEVTRHFGGSEEGGWWYNWYEPINSVPTSTPGAMSDYFKAQYGDRAQGDIYSVLGGVAVEVIVERKPCENRTTERPHYE